MKKILESDKSFYFIVALSIIIPLIIGLCYAYVVIFS